MDIQPPPFAPARAFFTVVCGECREEGRLEMHLRFNPSRDGRMEMSTREGDCWVCDGCRAPHLVQFGNIGDERCIGVRLATSADIKHLPANERRVLEQLQASRRATA